MYYGKLIFIILLLIIVFLIFKILFKVEPFVKINDGTTTETTQSPSNTIRSPFDIVNPCELRAINKFAKNNNYKKDRISEKLDTDYINFNSKMRKIIENKLYQEDPYMLQSLGEMAIQNKNKLETIYNEIMKNISKL